MAWMASNLFVKCTDISRVTAALEELLRLEGHRADQEGILDPPGPVVVSPAYEGWVAVTGVRAWVDDLVWTADRLSTACGETTLSFEIIGNCYRLRHSEQRAGQEQHIRRTPDYGWDLDNDSDKPDTMPRYEDAEKAAWEFLMQSGVPAPLATIGTLPLGHEPAAMLSLGAGTALSPDNHGRVSKEPREVCVVPYDSGDPPSLPTNISRDFGLMLFEERYLDGAPDDGIVDHLLAIEGDLLERARRALPGVQDLTLTVAYNASIHQDLLDGLLRARNRSTLSSEHRLSGPRWWQFWRHLGRWK